VLRLRDHTLTLAELLTEHTPGYEPPSVRRPVLTQVHCHQHAVMGWDADEKLLKQAGANAEHLDTGCCGLAGNFGFQAGHGEVSRAIAERALLPKLRAASPGAVILADGFSCRTQIHELDSGGREGMHLAELLATVGNLGYDRPEQAAAPRPAPPGTAAKAATVLGAATAAALATAAAALLRRRLTRRTRT
jgi:Fe-S oxidoreductase